VSDAPQQLTLDAFRQMMEELAPIAAAVGRQVLKPSKP